MKIRIEEVARPACRLPIINNPTIYLEDQGLLAAANFSDARKETNLFLINVQTMTSDKYPVPDQQYGPYGFTRGADGRLYLGFFGGRIYAFDLTTKTFSKVAEPFPDKLIWGGGASSTGKIYMGVYPTGEFCEYDLATKTCNTFSPMPQEKLGFYAVDFVALPADRMLVYIYGAKPTIIIYDSARQEIVQRHYVQAEDDYPASHSFVRLDDERVIFCAKKPAMKIYNFQENRLEGDFLGCLPEKFSYLKPFAQAFIASGLSSGKVYRFDRHGFKVIKTGFKNGNTASGGVHPLGHHEFVCLGDNGLFSKFNLDNGREENLQVSNETNDGMNIQMLKRSPAGRFAVGSHFINSQIFLLDLATGRTESSLNKIVTSSGQINCATFLNDVCYLGSYGKAIISAYWPDRPFVFGANPRQVAVTGEAQNRPVSMVNDGRFVYMASKADYQTLGGAITVLDPEAEKLEVYRNFVPTHNPTSLFYHPRGLLVGTTEVYGDQRSHAPVDPHGVIFVWDVKTRKTVHRSCPWESESLSACALSPDGTLIGFSANRYYLFRTDDFSCQVKSLELARISGGVFLNAKSFFGQTGDGHYFCLDIERNTLEPAGAAQPTRFYEPLSAHEFLIEQDGYKICKLTITP